MKKQKTTATTNQRIDLVVLASKELMNMDVSE